MSNTINSRLLNHWKLSWPHSSFTVSDDVLGSTARLRQITESAQCHIVHSPKTGMLYDKETAVSGWAC